MKPERSEGGAVGRYLGAGLTWALATLLFLGVGTWLGERMGSRSVGALLGAFVGGGAGFYWMVRQLTAVALPGRRDGGSGSADGSGETPAGSRVRDADAKGKRDE